MIENVEQVPFSSEAHIFTMFEFQKSLMQRSIQIFLSMLNQFNLLRNFREVTLMGSNVQLVTQVQCKHFTDTEEGSIVKHGVS